MALSCRIPPGHPDGGGLLLGFLHDSRASRGVRGVQNHQNLGGARSLQNRWRCKTALHARQLFGASGQTRTRYSALCRGSALGGACHSRCAPSAHCAIRQCKRSNAAPRTVGSSKAVWKQVFSSGRPSWPRRAGQYTMRCIEPPPPPPAAPSVSLPCCA